MWLHLGVKLISNRMDIRTLNIRLGCHRLPDRSFTIKGKPMPFCARCFGASIGHLFSFTLFCIGLLPPFCLCFIFIFIIFLDWSIQEWFGIMSTNSRRFVTGIIGGIGVGAIWWRTITYLIERFI